MRAGLHVAAGQARWALGLTGLGVLAQLGPAAVWLLDAGIAPSWGDLLRVAWPRAVAFALPTALALHAVSWRQGGDALAWMTSGRRAWTAGAVAVLLVWLPVLLVPTAAALREQTPAARLRLAWRAVDELWQRPLAAVEELDALDVAVAIPPGAGLRAMLPVGGDGAVLGVVAERVESRPGALLASGVRVGRSVDHAMLALCEVDQIELRLPDPGRDLAALGPRELPGAALARHGLRWRRAQAWRGRADPGRELAGEQLRRHGQLLALLAAALWGAGAFAGSGPVSSRRALLLFALPGASLALFAPRMLAAVLVGGAM